VDLYDPDREATPDIDIASREPGSHFLRRAPMCIPHPLECERRRPPRQARWSPSRDRGHRSRPRKPRSHHEGWHSPRLRTAPDGGPIRINFNYRNGFTTSAGFGLKPGRDQYFEGPHEAAYFRLLETDCDTIDYQFQPVQAEWTTARGETRRYTFDAVREAAELELIEIKADWSYFHEPQTADTLAAAEEAIAQHGLKLKRVVGSDLIDNVRSRIIKDVFACRLTAFGQRERDLVQELITAAGGHAPLGLVRERLSNDRYLARAIANAMLVRRAIGFSLTRPPSADTPVHLPATPAASKLRALLHRHCDDAS
jgi:hypothetical protein